MNITFVNLPYLLQGESLELVEQMEMAEAAEQAMEELDKACMILEGEEDSVEVVVVVEEPLAKEASFFSVNIFKFVNLFYKSKYTKFH